MNTESCPLAGDLWKARKMTSEEPKRLNALCKRIKDEQDPRVFSLLLKQLDELLEATREPPPPPLHAKTRGNAA